MASPPAGGSEFLKPLRHSGASREHEPGHLGHGLPAASAGEYDASFPPTIITSGTRDMLLSDVVRLHRKLVNAGVETELHVWEGAPHGFFMGRAPEDHEHIQQVRTFLHSQLR